MSTTSPVGAAGAEASPPSEAAAAGVVASRAGSALGAASAAGGAAAVAESPPSEPLALVAVAARRCWAGSVVGRDLGQDCSDADRVAFGGVDLDHGAGRRGGDLCVDLVGRDLDEDLVGLDSLPLLLVPLKDGALGHRFAHLRQGDLHCGVDRHVSEHGL
jgi:hypothetical protein